MLIEITPRPIELSRLMQTVRHASCGAVSVFEGNVRAENHGQKVLALEYEVYDTFFYAEVGRIFAEITARWGTDRLGLIQRIGKLEIGDTGIVIAVASPHRRSALEACAYAIEVFKKRAPVWKKEYFPTGANWVRCHDHDEISTHVPF